jgi:hypothetical protein
MWLKQQYGTNSVINPAHGAQRQRFDHRYNFNQD